MNRSRMLQAAGLLTLLCASSWAQTVSESSWIGVWNGTLEGQPGVTLTLADDHGQLGGTIVFNFIIGPPPNSHIGGSDTHMVGHPQLKGDTLSFQVTRGDGKLLQLVGKLIDSDRVEMRCVNCEDSPVTTMVKFRP